MGQICLLLLFKEEGASPRSVLGIFVSIRKRKHEVAELLKLKVSRGGREEEEETTSMLGVPDFLLEPQLGRMFVGFP